MIRVPTCSPARAERLTALALAFPESLPAFPPAWNWQVKESLNKVNQGTIETYHLSDETSREETRERERSGESGVRDASDRAPEAALQPQPSVDARETRSRGWRWPLSRAHQLGLVQRSSFSSPLSFSPRFV